MNEILEKLLRVCTDEMIRAYEIMDRTNPKENMFDFYSGYKNAMKDIVDEITQLQGRLNNKAEKGGE